MTTIFIFVGIQELENLGILPKVHCALRTIKIAEGKVTMDADCDLHSG